ncbi:MAG: rhodanese-like domain-containing protein [Ignavibacteria bacterium]|nr:rhodanese-like domain-containing protein [Ignavibacteria bacterium]
MQKNVRKATREAGAIVILACLLGFSYTAFHGKGLFSSNHDGTPARSGQPAPQRITYVEAMRYLKEESALFVDARHGFDFQLGHIPGAINIPLAEAESLLPVIASLPKMTTIIVYCDGQECNSSEALAHMLIANGCTDVKVFVGGWNDWQRYAGGGK